MISSEDRNMRKLVRTDEIFGQSQIARRVSKSAGVLKPQKSGLAADKLDLFDKRLPLFFLQLFSVFCVYRTISIEIQSRREIPQNPRTGESCTIIEVIPLDVRMLERSELVLPISSSFIAKSE